MMGLAGRSRAVLGALTALMALLAAAAGSATAADRHDPGEESGELAEAVNWFSAPRTAPNDYVPGAAFPAAVKYAAGVATVDKTAWQELGPYKYLPDNRNYISQPFSNSGSGSGYNSGRMTAVAVAPDGAVFAGGAGGGVWRSTDSAHQSWTPLFDNQATTAIGALAVEGTARSYTVYAGTGEANFNQDAYAGIGILKSTDRGATWTRMGGDELQGATIYKIEPNGARGVLAATNRGLFRWSGTSWQRVLGEDNGGLRNLQALNSVTDVAVRPSTGGQEVVAVRGWRAGAATNGLYVSRDGGSTFTGPLNPQGYVPAKAQGRTTIAYSADGKRLYAMVQDANAFNTGAGNTILEGIYSSHDDVNGPFTQIASPANLQNSGSAMKPGDIGPGYQPGVQAWYNQFLVVDPQNPEHLYAGLEEVYESVDGGHSWIAAAPYWNLTLKCFDLAAADFGGCPNTVHSDQHAATVVDGRLWVGNDGGIFSRPTTVSTAGGGWQDHNARLGTLQFYYASSGRIPATGTTAYWGGLQDNGTAKLIPSADTFNPTEASQPFGGDGGATVVDPSNADKVLTEYVDLDIATTTDGGRNWVDIAPGDPSPLFIAPFTTDRNKVGDVYAGGEFLWKSTKGFGTRSTDWARVADTGAGHSISALDVVDGKGLAAWCGPCQPGYLSEAGFNRGFIANAGGGWKALSAPAGVPLRYTNGVTVTQADQNGLTAYVAFGGYVRHWFIGPDDVDPGVGHVYKVTVTPAGEATWTDVTGDLVDAPANDVISVGGRLVVATDVGVFTQGAQAGTWKRVGTGLPNTIVDDLSITPNGDILAATHGRGLWLIAPGALS